MKLPRKLVMASLTAACVTTAVLQAHTPAAIQKPTMEGYPAAGSPAIIKLISPGAEPRKALRYAVPAGYKGQMDMSMTMAMNVNVGGMAMPMNLPTVKMTADLGVDSVAPNGDMSYSIAFTGATVDAAGGEANPMLAGALQGIQNAIAGIKGTATVSSRGLVKSAKIDAGSAGSQAQQMMGELTSQIENLATAFPEEAVGVGAKWETRSAISAAGQFSFQKTTMEVVSIDGATVNLKFAVEQTTPPQPFTNSALPAGTEVQLDGAKGTGSGTNAIRLDTLVPKGESTINSTMSMTLSMGGQSQAMTMENSVKLTVAPSIVK